MHAINNNHYIFSGFLSSRQRLYYKGKYDLSLAFMHKFQRYSDVAQSMMNRVVDRSLINEVWNCSLCFDVS